MSRRRAFLVLSAIGVGTSSAFAADDQVSLSLNPLGTMSKSALDGFRTRPLFNPAREEPRAPAPPPVYTPPPPPPAPPPNLRIVGIIHGDEDIAVIRLDQGLKTSTLHTGDRIGPWSVTILPDGLRARDATRAFDYALYPRGPAGTIGPVAVDPKDSDGELGATSP